MQLVCLIKMGRGMGVSQRISQVHLDRSSTATRRLLEILVGHDAIAIIVQGLADI